MSKLVATALQDLVTGGQVPVETVRSAGSKSYFKATQSGTQALVGSFNVTSLTDLGVGLSQVTMAVSFAALASTVASPIGNAQWHVTATVDSVNQYEANAANTSHAATDSANVGAVAFGPLA